MTLRYFPRTEFLRRKRVSPALAALLMALAAAGCHPFPQAYSGRDVIGPFAAEGRASLRERDRSDAREEENARRSRPAEPPGHIKPVGYTQKNFGDMEKSQTTLPPTSGEVQWSDAPMQIGEAGPAASADAASPLVRNLAAYDDVGAPDIDAVFLDGAAASLPRTEGGAAPDPVKTALAESIEHAGGRNAAEISFLPETNPAQRAEPLPENGGDWRDATHQAIALLQEEIARRVREGEICAAEEARLRLLLLTTGNIPGAAEKIAGMDPNLQVFWERECRGLGRFIESQESSEKDAGEKTAWTETLPDFQEGVRALKTGMPLAVRKSVFVKEPSVFGYYEEVDASFAPGETVNAYFELDNVVCQTSDGKGGCDIAVLCRRELTDSLHRNVVETKEKLCRGHSASPLNDIVLNLSVALPKHIPAGTYTLKTVFLDQHSALAQPVTHTMEIRVD